SGGALRCRVILPLAALVIVALALVRIGAGSALGTDFFLARRFAFPITYPNGAGSFYLLLVWPLLWLAADSRGRVWMRAVCLGSVPVLIQLGLLTQSRGAAVALVCSTVVYFILTPARLRSLIFLAIPANLVALSFTPLTSYYAEGAGTVSRTVALLWLGGSWGAAAVAGALLVIAESRVTVARPVRVATSLVIVVALVAGAVFGVFALQDRVGDLSSWATGIVDRFVSDEGGDAGESIGESRFGDMGGNGRWIMWTTAWKGFQESPVVGNGAGSYRYLNELHRTNHTVDARQAHSIELDALSETGVVGSALLLGTLGMALGVALAPRFRSWWELLRRRRALFLAPEDAGGHHAVGAADQAWVIALVAAFLFWFIQASVDWTWHVPGVTLGALLLLAFALSTSAPDTAAAIRPRSRHLSGLLFRVGLGVASLAVLVGAAMPYLSMQYQNVALAKMSHDTHAALADSSTALSLFPVSAEPLLVRSDVYRAAATNAIGSTDPVEQGYRVASGLALSLAAAERAIEKDEASGLVHQIAGRATLDLLAARDPSIFHDKRTERWDGLAEASLTTDPAALERSVRTLAATDSEAEAANQILALTSERLVARATAHLRASQERNPTEPSVIRLLEALED
ncbi:MAG: O-antigen ligase family protein, partial [Thermoleophilia bacterium]|nr:O-antigen ligase family protein [Thermoleophilia bacterium]